MRTVPVTLTHDSAERFGSTKAGLRAAFKNSDNVVEFITIGDLFTRRGAYVTAREAAADGVDMLEVRSPDHVKLIAALYLSAHPSGAVHVEVK